MQEKSKVIISADSAADLNDLFKTHDIGEFPLFVGLGDNQYLDNVDITPQMIFDYYNKNKTLPKTAARSIEDFREYFTSFTEKGYSVVHITISSKISSTYEHAALAAKEIPGAYAVDSLSLS